MSRGKIFGLTAAWIVRLSSDGFATGQLDPDSVGVGPTVSPAFMIKGGMSLTPANPTFATVEHRSYGRPEGKIIDGVDTISTATLEINEWDSALDVLLNGGAIDTTSLGGAEISSANNINPTPNTLAFCGIAKVKPPVGASAYIHFFYPRCTIRRSNPTTEQTSGQQTNPNTITLNIEPSIYDRFPVGVAFGVNQGWYGYENFEFELRSAYPYFMDTWIADGSATTFNLSLLPKYSTVTGGKLNNWVTKEGVETAPTSISTSTKAVVVAAAGSASDVWNVMYQVDAGQLATLL